MATTTKRTPRKNPNTDRPVGETRRTHLERVKSGAKSTTRKARADRLAAVTKAKARK